MKAWLLAGLVLALPAGWLHADDTVPGAQAAPQGAVAAEAWAMALEAAWTRHPQARALIDRVSEAEARAALAKAMTPGPASLTLGHLGDNLTGNRGKREWEIELAAPLWLPGQKAAHLVEAAGAAGVVAAQRATLRLQIAGELREAWWAVSGARNDLDLARRRVDTARALEADVLRRYQAGDLARTDANLARSERLAAEAEEAEVRSTLLQTEQAWLALTGLPAPASLPGPGEAVTPRETVTEHPRLALAAAIANTARARLRVAEATRRDAPELALRLVRDRGDAAESYNNAVGIQLKLPFSADARVRMGNAAARAEMAEAEAELLLSRQKLELDMAKAQAALATAERQTDMARERQRLATDNLRLSEKAFALGESDLTTLLRIRAAAFEADLLLHRQQVARQAAQSRLNQTLGVLP